MNLRLMLPVIAATYIAASSFCPALDLTPTRAVRQLEGGFTTPVLGFSDGARKVTYMPPWGWEARGNETTLELLPPDPPQVTARFTLHTRTVQMGDLSSTGREYLEKWLPTLLPKDAKEITLSEVYENSFPFGQYSSREYNYRYRLNGQEFVRSLSIVDLNQNQRLMIEVSARGKDFENVRDTFIRSLARWNWED